MKQEKGFTLIELLVVIIILGILLAVAIPRYFEGVTQAKQRAFCSTIANLKMAIETKRATNYPQYTYPETATEVNALLGDPKYFNSHPKEPWTGTNFVVSANEPQNSNETYIIQYKVEDNGASYTLKFWPNPSATHAVTECP